MRKKMLVKAYDYLAQKKSRSLWLKGVTVLACAVVFCTVYALILPALTLEKPVCGLEEHTHTADCYVKANEETELICSPETLGIHTHSESCYDGEGNISCGYADFVIHTHDAGCYDEKGELVCPLPEIAEHAHTDDCYASSQESDTIQGHTHTDECYVTERGELICGKTETDGHEHSEDCSAAEQEKLICKLEETDGHTHTEKCGVTEQKKLICKKEETDGHTHTEACWSTEKELICGQEETGEHVHTESCYDEEGNLNCGKEETKGHYHSDDCNKESRSLTCGQEEAEAHHHDTDCYEITSAAACGMEETEGHHHSADCYEQGSGEGCTLEETEAHHHDDACYETGKKLICTQTEEPAAEDEAAQREPVCEKEEIVPHVHTSDCYGENGELDCGKLQVKEHVHTEECFQTKQLADPDELTCKKPESEGHSHTEDCYDEKGELICKLEESPGHKHSAICYGNWKLICELEEHTHTEECYDLPLTEEEQKQVDEVIALINELPDREEIEEKLKAFEEAEDEEGYDAYLTEISRLVKEAYQKYSALTDAQKKKVTNAAKLMELEPIWSAQTLEEFPPLEGDSAYVTGITVTGISDGTGPWDADDNAGNDSNADNKIVRTFDTVTYKFQVPMASYDNTISYSEARVKLEFVLPLTSDQAVFDQGAMAWMDQTSGYEPTLTTETRTIDGVDTQCQVLTCYKHLLPSEGHQSVVPGAFGENVTVNVKSMTNGADFAPIFSAAMEGGTWDGECEKHGQQEKYTVTADKVKVSAAPKYNIKIGGQSTYKSTFDFNTGNEKAAQYGDAYNIGSVTGRVVKLGVAIELYNDNASKGFKGIELPNGNPITFDLSLEAKYTINTDSSPSGKPQGTTVDVTGEGYTPLLWSCDGNLWTVYGAANGDGRVLHEAYGCAQAIAPYNKDGGENACYSGGSWSATQKGGTIHVKVSGYQVDVDHMPIRNADWGDIQYGEELGIGVFSAGEVWIVQPYNKTNSSSVEPNFDIVEKYGSGAFTTSVYAINMNAATVSGTVFKDTEGTNDAQTKKDDDRVSLTVELTLPGSLQNRVRYADYTDYSKGVGTSSNRDGQDFATVGTKIYLMGGFSYSAENEERNNLYWGTNLTKFYGSAIEVLDGTPIMQLTGDAITSGMTVYYAAKPDGSDWSDDNELKETYENALVFYKSVSEIPQGHLCVGLLYCFKGPGNPTAPMPYYYGYVPAKVREDMGLTGKTYMLASTSRVWTKSMFEDAGMTLENIPDWSDSDTELSSFPDGSYRSANIDGSTWYKKETYAADGSGALGTHNSDWAHWGDTLLVIGYKTGITKNLMQRDSKESSEKHTYNLDAGQRVTDFKLQPRTYYDQGSNNHVLTTTVTIVDILPEYLTYKAGSCYFGGTYKQTSPNGGSQGIVTGGTLREPDRIDKVLDKNKNETGETRLTWVIPDVTVGAEMPAIYYSANIGNRDNPAKDVPEGTTDMINSVRITASHDLREPSLPNGNYAEVGMAVTRGAAASYGKYSEQGVVEADGKIDYVIYYDNNGSTAETRPVLVDAMPQKGTLGSSFSGTYFISSFKISLVGTNTNLSDLEASLSYTLDKRYAGKDLQFLQNHQENPIGEWEAPVTIEEDGTVPGLVNKMPVMWVLNCESLPGNSELRVEYTIQLQPEKSSSLDNIKYINAFSTSTTTTTTETPAVNRILEGLTWLDDNADGIQNEADDRRISGVKVKLLKLRTGGDSAQESDYEEYHYQDDFALPVVEIETGKTVSVRASGSSSANEYENGRYKFTDLPAGIFAVQFTDGTGEIKISPLIASPSNRGNNDTQDSDGIATYSDDRSRLEKTTILGIEMPKAEDMQVVLYESKYHDSGFYEKGHELPETGGSGTTPYTIGGLLLLTGAGLLLLYNKKKRGREDFASS